MLALGFILLSSCASTRPEQCAAEAPTFDSQVFTANGPFWFSHALVKRGYHGAGIGGEELLRVPTSLGVAMRLVVRPAPDCPFGERAWRIDRPANFRRISGRGTFDPSSKTFTLECLCDVEATDYTDPQGRFALYY